MDKQEFEHITVFLPNGATLRFEQVTNCVLKTTALTFDYVSASDKKPKSALFFTSHIVGLGFCPSAATA